MLIMIFNSFMYFMRVVLMYSITAYDYTVHSILFYECSAPVKNLVANPKIISSLSIWTRVLLALRNTNAYFRKHVSQVQHLQICEVFEQILWNFWKLVIFPNHSGFFSPIFECLVMISSLQFPTVSVQSLWFSPFSLLPWNCFDFAWFILSPSSTISPKSCQFSPNSIFFPESDKSLIWKNGENAASNAVERREFLVLRKKRIILLSLWTLKTFCHSFVPTLKFLSGLKLILEFLFSESVNWEW